MKKLTALAACALTAPVITFGIGSALAAEGPADDAGAKEQRTEQEQRHMPSQARKDHGMATADGAQEQRKTAERMKQHMKTRETFLSNTPGDAIRSNDLIGADLRSRIDNETIGPVTDLVIDQDGRVVAVIVEAGGFLGLGEKEVAISWNSIERRRNEDGEGYSFSVDTTEEALSDAPEYKATGSGAGTKKY